MFPVLSRMTMDILSVQATSVASGSAFSTNFEDEILDAEVQENEAIPLSDEEIAIDADEGSMFGPGSGGEEPEYGYDVHHDDY
ncbi:zinc finger BED domain-containing protein RICESLEEPER 3 [Tanacetum coccineum]